jgi:hypothetical protein
MDHDMNLAIVIGTSVVMGLAIVVGLPVFLGVRHARKVRELEHAERMKALELGRPWPGSTPAETSAATSSSPGTQIGVWVPLGALGIAWLSSGAPWQSGGVSGIIWGAAGSVGVAGVICGSILAIRDTSRLGRQQTTVNLTKPYQHDPDEFDVASRRG